MGGRAYNAIEKINAAIEKNGGPLQVKHFKGKAKYADYTYNAIPNIFTTADPALVGALVYNAIENAIELRQEYGLKCEVLGASVMLLDKLMLHAFGHITGCSRPEYIKSLNVSGLVLRVEQCSYNTDIETFIIL